MPTCTEGHASKAADYCDVCGAPIGSRRRTTRFVASGRGEGLPGVRGAGERPLLRSMRTRFGAARTGSAAAASPRTDVGRMDRRRERRPGVL